MSGLSPARGLVKAALPAAYVVLVHAATLTGRPVLAAWGLVGLAGGLALLSSGRIAAAWAIVAALLLVVAGGGAGPGLGVLALPTVLNLTALALFARTLRPGAEPLITRIARIERGDLTPALAAYTRALTVAWCALFALAAIGGAWLALAADTGAWSWFTNVACPALMLGFFLGEHVYRALRFGEASVLRTLRVMARPECWT